MACGIARPRWSTAPAALVILTLLGVPALPQAPSAPAMPSSPPAAAPPAPPAVPAPPPFVGISNDCEAGSTPTSSDSALPQVARALEQSKPIKILTIGASAGKRATRGGYSGIIETMLERAIGQRNVEMINRGISGEMAADAAKRIRLEVALNEPTLVLWQVGTNDALAYVSVEELEETIRDTIRWLKEHDVDVVLVGLQYVGQMAQDENYAKVRDMLRRVATEEKIMIVRRYEAMKFIAEAAKAGPDLFDQLDRAGNGYDCLAQYVARAIALGAFGKGLKPPPPKGAVQQPPPR